MTWVARRKARALGPALDERRAWYSARTSRAERESVQLEALNREWNRLLRDVPYHGEQRDRLGLPETFESIEEFLDRVPPTDRGAVQRHRDAMSSRSRPADWTRMTGGSTAAPVQLPAWREELRHTSVDLWFARTWFGVRRDSRLFQIWGHSHLLGRGWRGRVNALKRRVSDRLLGYLRFSAYDLRPEVLRGAGLELLRFAPEYVLGYSVALHALARANEDRAERFRALGLKVAIATAEAFPHPDARGTVERVLGCPVAMEYGAVECGVVAHEHPEGGYRSFWRTFLLEAESSGTGRHLLRLTSLYPRAFPLVRYEIGDEIELLEPNVRREWSIDRFHRVVGRCNDYVEIDGAMIHSEAFAHAVRPCEAIRGFQVVQGSRGLRIRYTAPAELGAGEVEAILERLRKIRPALGAARLERVESLPQTVAGKTRMVVQEAE